MDSERSHRPRHHRSRPRRRLRRQARGACRLRPRRDPGRAGARAADGHVEGSFWRGEALEILDASPHRIPHVWRQADIDVPPEERPGGADFGHIALAHQRELKAQVAARVAAAVRRHRRSRGRHGGGASDPLARRRGHRRGAADGTRWRTRVSLHVDADGRVGPYAARSHRVIAVDDLPLATAERRAGGPRPAAWRAGSHRPGAARRRRRSRHRPARAGGGRRGRRGARGRPAGPARRPRCVPDAAREIVVERVGARDFPVDAGGFWQVHRLAAHSLSPAGRGACCARCAQTALPSIRMRGTSTCTGAWGCSPRRSATSAALPRVSPPWSPTLGPPSTPARTSPTGSARAPRPRGSTGGSRALGAEASLAERERLSRGVVVLDPPRSGAGREVVEGIADLEPATVVYVACDPVALARDLATFRPLGYDSRRSMRSTSSRTRTMSRRSPSSPGSSPPR